MTLRMRALQIGIDQQNAAKLSPAEARALSDVAHRASGVAISPDKRGFLEMRVGRRLREIGCPNFQRYLALLNGPGGLEEQRHLVEALTTHTTAFFREKGHFDWLSDVGLPTLADKGCGKIQPLVVWSAACSLGSEMWTAAMVVDRFARRVPGGLRWEVVGTDISRKILRRAAQAVFSAEEIADLPEDFRRDYLLRSKPAAVSKMVSGRSKAQTLRYRIVPELRNRAQLAHVNIVNPSPSLSLVADIAFLRNVLIYFRPEDKRRAVTNVTSKLRVGGYLLTGHSESLADAPKNLRQIGASIYQKVASQ